MPCTRTLARPTFGRQHCCFVRTSYLLRLTHAILHLIKHSGDSYSKCDDHDTWIDHLQHHLKNEPSLISAPKVLNLASPGASAQDDLQSQLSRFLSTIRKTQALDPDKTTYFIFLGINDLSLMDEDELDSVAELISDAMHDLYVKARARNFVVLDVPPVDFSPQAECSDAIRDRIQTFNSSSKPTQPPL
ncbi:hypothetical protein H2248_010233 [Termitomyces sp. 'cryptogamus']|nr:hypothetical protein H2248_010233 [Termitomyces sp. 'cryptogamus']